MAVSDAGERKAVGLSSNARALFAACAVLAGAIALGPPTPILVFAFVLCGWIASVGVHEFGHAFVAYKAGDHTVVEKGYLTLDPLKYGDLTLTVLLPVLALLLGGIGFPGGAVYLREDLMRSRLGRSLASLAGPAGTALVLLALAGAIRLMLAFGEGDNPLTGALAVLAFLQATALLLNLLPVPGLDGYGVLRPFIPAGLRRALAPIERIAFFILLGAIFLLPGSLDDLFKAALDICRALGVPAASIALGWADFHFWQGG